MEKHLRAELGPFPLSQVGEKLEFVLNVKVGALGPESLNHLRAAVHRALRVPHPQRCLEGREPGVRCAALQGPEALAALPPPGRGPARARRARRALARPLRHGGLSRAPPRRGHRAPQVRRGPRRRDDPRRAFARLRDDEGRLRGPAPHPGRAHALDRARRRGVTLGGPLPARGWRAARARSATAGRSPPRAGSRRNRQWLDPQVPAEGLRSLRAPLPRRAGQVSEVRHAPLADRRPEAATLPHLRHSTATLLLKAGVPLATVQRILRHTDPKNTAEVYGHLDVGDMREGLSRLHLAPAVTDLGPLAAS